MCLYEERLSKYVVEILMLPVLDLESQQKEK